MAADRKPRKIRIELRKNRGKRTRQSDLTRSDLDEIEDLQSRERLSGKGELTRFRTIVADSGESGAIPLRDVDRENILRGRVLMAVGANQCRVQTDSGKVYLCTVRRLVRTLARETRNAVVAGDRVLITPDGPETGVIERVEPRESALSRGSRHQAHVIVSNVEQAVIVASVAFPGLKPGLIDRFLCSIEKGGIRGIICLNKIDLGHPHLLQPLIGQYTQLGYPVILTDALHGQGIDELRELLKGRETVFTGQSGVGKSSLLNAVEPGLRLATGAVSHDTTKGRHTTRVTQLLPLTGGGVSSSCPLLPVSGLHTYPRAGMCPQGGGRTGDSVSHPLSELPADASGR
jgi:ribosome biogenesis GTPase